MYEKLVSLLTLKFSQARKDGLQQLARSLALQVADEAEAQALVDKLSSEKVTDFIKEWRKEVDSEVTKSTKTYEENLKSKYNLVEKKESTQDPKPETPNDIQAIISKAVNEAVKPLQEELTKFKSGETVKTRRQTLEETLKDAPKAFKSSILKHFDKMQFSDEEDFNSFVTDTQNDLKEAQQEVANNGLNSFPRPTGATTASSSKQVQDDIKKWAESSKNNN